MRRVLSEDYMEIECRDDYISVLMERDYSRHEILNVFAKILYYANGRMKPRYHGRWIGARFRDFQSLVGRA